ncbi:MAG TPA: AmmeMemoRadiSam system radical SAM enzyme [Victivallales bacterium]|nr:AmmeMemoRadiSam system radical SAM enzyme [Victivallales bacterium]
MYKIQCELCPRYCLIAPGESGDCRIRVNIDGELIAVTYGHPCALHVDPIEKKPLFHFLPGSDVFSIATVGCNLHCKNCQNWEISQQPPVKVPAYKVLPEQVAELMEKYRCESTAYTYTDPSVFYEYALDSSIEVRKKNKRNVLVTAGYFNPKPLKELCKYTDAANVDLKAFSNEFYQNVCSATLKPVLNSLVIMRNAEIHIEVTNLLLPTLNDSDKDITNLCRWVKENLGKEIPLHFSRFSPQYRMRNLPPTSVSTLRKAKEIAESLGMQYVYIGNVAGRNFENTFCPKCKSLLVERIGYIVKKNIIKDGKCPFCGTIIYGIW